MLPYELLLEAASLNYPCRELQLRSLTCLIKTSVPSIVIHGLEATGKTAITRHVLDGIKKAYAFIDCRQCITGRHLLEQTVASAADALQEHYGVTPPESLRCENLTALNVQLSLLLAKGQELVLVFDGIDRQKEAPPSLLPALARLGESIPSLTCIFIVTVPSPRLFHTPGLPHLHFPPYTREESIKILSQAPPKIFPNGLDPNVDYTEEEAAEDDAWVWGRHCGVVWDTLAKGAARDLISFRDACNRLWKPFTQPIVDGAFGTRDFPRLLVSRRTIFQDESVLLRNIVHDTKSKEIRLRASHELPYYSKYILCAAYLASFNPAKQDHVFFMKSHDKKRKKKAGGGQISKHRKIPRSMLAPSPFPLDRMFAILQAIIPHAFTQNADLLAQVATLTSLRLIIRAGAATTADQTDSGSRWKINCAWEFVAGLASNIGFEIRDYLAGSLD